jgi:hypothetical protein
MHANIDLGQVILMVLTGAVGLLVLDVRTRLTTIEEKNEKLGKQVVRLEQKMEDLPCGKGPQLPPVACR